MKPLILIALLPVLSGCIAFPTFERFEFREEQLTFIEPGVTTRALLEKRVIDDRMLTAERRSGRLVVYADYRSVVGVVAENAYDTFGSRDYLVVEYDDEHRVVWFESLKGSGSCTSTGICVRKGITEYGPRPMELLVYASQTEDEVAKSFAAPAGSCNVYAWSEPGSFCPARGGVRLSFDSNEPRQWTGFTPQVYARWALVVPETDDARMQVEATHRFIMGRGEPPPNLAVDCVDGRNVFVEITPRCRMLGTVRGFDIRMVPESEGREAVMDRQLILN